jgi:hypothetical protein
MDLADTCIVAMTERHRKAYVLTVDRRDFSADRRNDGKRSTSSRHQSLIGPARNACRSYAPRRTSGWCLDANRSPSKASAATRAGEAPGSSPLLAAGVGRVRAQVTVRFRAGYSETAAFGRANRKRESPPSAQSGSCDRTMHRP